VILLARNATLEANIVVRASPPAAPRGTTGEDARFTMVDPALENCQRRLSSTEGGSKAGPESVILLARNATLEAKIVARASPPAAPPGGATGEDARFTMAD